MRTPGWTAALLLALSVSGFAQQDGPPAEKPKSEEPIPDVVPLPDRWRIPFSYYPLNEPGSLVDPYHQNILKGDYPILGQNIFMSLSARSDTTRSDGSLLVRGLTTMPEPHPEVSNHPDVD